MPKIFSEDNDGLIERVARDDIPKNAQKWEIDDPPSITGNGTRLKDIKVSIARPPAKKCFNLWMVVDEGRTLDQPPCV